MTTPILLSVADACRAVGIGKSSFYEAVSRGEITLKKLGRKSLVVHADLVAWASRLPDAGRNPEVA
jgi:excisionase family DNA binding protein